MISAGLIPDSHFIETTGWKYSHLEYVKEYWEKLVVGCKREEKFSATINLLLWLTVKVRIESVSIWSTQIILCVCVCVCVCVCSRVRLWSPGGCSVHGILQARILEWAVLSYSTRISRPRDQTCVSCISCIGRPAVCQLYHLGSPQIMLLRALFTSET